MQYNYILRQSFGYGFRKRKMCDKKNQTDTTIIEEYALSTFYRLKTIVGDASLATLNPHNNN